MTWRVLVSAPYFIPVIDEWQQRLTAEGVELVHRGPEVVRARAHLVERDQPVVAVEGGVLNPLGHHGPADLLEAHDDLGPLRLVGENQEGPALEGGMGRDPVGQGAGLPQL